MCSHADDQSSVIESWEDFDDNPELLDKQLKQMSVQDPNLKCSQDTTHVRIIDDGNHTQYPMKNESKIMILKRPPKTTSSSDQSNASKYPAKTLEQRQTEYAEARLRILGDAGSKEDSEQTLPKPVDDYQFENSEFFSDKDNHKKERPIAIVKPSQTNHTSIQQSRPSEFKTNL